MGDPEQRYGKRAERAHKAFAALAAVALISACESSVSVSTVGATVPLTLAVTPPAGMANLPISTEVGITLSGGQITDVSVTNAGNAEKIAGTMRDDGTSWIPAAPLAFSSTYNVAVTGRGTDGSQTVTKSTSFTTMGQPGGQFTTGGLYPSTGETVGVAMPVVLDFNPPVPDAVRPQVQKRLFVTTNPPQPGAWHWVSGAQVWYRPPSYWQPGTTIMVRAALAGLPMGEDRFGAGDRSTTVTVGPKMLIDIENATKRLSVYIDDTLVKTMPVSLGAEETPSSSGHMVVMSKEPTSQFFADLTVNNAMRLTAGGEYIHAAPWSVADQGVRNVSHGCTNLSEENAAWVFRAAHLGDPVIVRGTETELTNGNGWTAWNVPWSEYIKSSALPVAAALAAVVSTPESVSAIAPPNAAPAPPSGAPAAVPGATPAAVPSR